MAEWLLPRCVRAPESLYPLGMLSKRLYECICSRLARRRRLLVVLVEAAAGLFAEPAGVDHTLFEQAVGTARKSQ